MHLILASASPRRQQLLRDAGFSFDVVVSDVDESSLDAQTPHELVEKTALLKAHAVAEMMWSAGQSRLNATHDTCNQASKLPELSADYCLSHEFDEHIHTNEDKSAHQSCAAHQRLTGMDSSRNADLIIAADTMVFVGDERLGKPQDKNDARRMMKLLSNARHQVITCVTFICPAGGVLHGYHNTKRLTSYEVLTHWETSYVRFKKLSDSEIETYLSTAHWHDKAGAYGIQEDAGGFVTELSGDFYNVMGLPIHWVGKTLSELGCSAQNLPLTPLTYTMATNGAYPALTIYPKRGDADCLGTPFGVSLMRPPILVVFSQDMLSDVQKPTSLSASAQRFVQALHEVHDQTHTVIAVLLPTARQDKTELSVSEQAAMVLEILDRLGVPEVRLICDLCHQTLQNACCSLRPLRFSSTQLMDMNEWFAQQLHIVDLPSLNQPHLKLSAITCVPPVCRTDAAHKAPDFDRAGNHTRRDVITATQPTSTWGNYLTQLAQQCILPAGEYEIKPTSLTMEPHLEVRTLHKDDRDEVHALYHRLLMYLENHNNYCGWKLGLYPTTNQIDCALHNGTLVGAFTLDTNELVGAASFACDAPDYYDACGWVKLPTHKTMMAHMLMTDPHTGRRGIARTLLAYGAHRAHDAGCVELRLNTSVQNVLSCRLYERLGFIRCYPLLAPYPDLDISDWTCVYTLPLAHHFTSSEEPLINKSAG